MDTYVFYDIETTGLNYAFDQILQFAAIRADASVQRNRAAREHRQITAGRHPITERHDSPLHSDFQVDVPDV